MSMPVNVDVDQATQDALNGLALGDLQVLGEALELREAAQESSGLDARTFSLCKIAALIALDSPPASYLWQIANALDCGRHARGDRGRAAGRRPAGRRAPGDRGRP